MHVLLVGKYNYKTVHRIFLLKYVLSVYSLVLDFLVYNSLFLSVLSVSDSGSQTTLFCN